MINQPLSFMDNNYRAPPIPSAFIWRRAHSLTGLWLVLFLIEHLLTNSQAALFLNDDGKGFIHAVNGLRDLPYLPVIEMVLLGIPFLIHGVWGIKYLFTGEFNSFPTNGAKPALTGHSRNHAYTWQRITSWILLFGIAAHVIHMRFLNYPTSATIEAQEFYMIPVKKNEGVYMQSKRLDFDLYDKQQIESMKQKILSQEIPQVKNESPEAAIALQKRNQELAWLKAIEKWPLKDNQLMAVTKTFGTAELLMVRDAFKSHPLVLLYSGLVLAACFHAFNGLWTGMITWGVTLTARSQQLMRKLATGLMVLLTFLGLAAIWGSYWI